MVYIYIIYYVLDISYLSCDMLLSRVVPVGVDFRILAIKQQYCCNHYIAHRAGIIGGLVIFFCFLCCCCATARVKSLIYHEGVDLFLGRKRDRTIYTFRLIGIKLQRMNRFWVATHSVLYSNRHIRVVCTSSQGRCNNNNKWNVLPLCDVSMSQRLLVDVYENINWKCLLITFYPNVEGVITPLLCRNGCTVMYRPEWYFFQIRFSI